MKTSLLIFMAADNNLYLSSISDINEMKRFNPATDDSILVQIDARGAFNFETPDEAAKLSSKRLTVASGNIKILKDLGETNSGDPKVLNDFLRWARTDFPSDKYYLVIWNHGGGIKDDIVVNRFGSKMKRPLFGKKDSADSIRWICQDDTSRDFLDIVELKNGLDAGLKFDFIGFDACLMAMIEVCYQLRNLTSYIIGSQEIEPSDGWPYYETLTTLFESPDGDLPPKLKHIVSSYVSSYATANGKVSLSAVSLSNIEELCKLVMSISVDIYNKYDTQKYFLMETLKDVQRFRDNDYIDLLHFFTLIANFSSDKNISSLCTKAANLLKTLIVHNSTQGSSLANANGLSIYFPVTAPSQRVLQFYQLSDFSQQFPGWIKLIKKYWNCAS